MRARTSLLDAMDNKTTLQVFLTVHVYTAYSKHTIATCTAFLYAKHISPTGVKFK